MMTKQLNEVLKNKDDDNLPSSKLRDLKQRKQRRKESEKMPVKKKAKIDWRLEHCAQSIGDPIKFTSEGEEKKRHYLTFKFRGTKYRLEDSVMLVPEEAKEEPYIAIIKDIYKQGKEEYVKLQVQWFYRPKDVEKKHVGKWKSKNSRDLFYSFHYDEVFAESVKHTCHVYFVPQNKQIPNHIDSGYIVQMVYDHIKKKLKKFTDESFDVQQKHDIDLLVAKTISPFGNLLDIEKVQKTKISRLKRSVASSLSSIRRSHGISVKINSSNDQSLYLDREKRLEELLKAVKPMCRRYSENQAGDNDFLCPNDVGPMVRALEQALYDSNKDNIPKYVYKSELLVEILKNSRVLARRFLNGELKPEQVIKMKPYELTRGSSFDEMKADLDEPISTETVASSSKSFGRKDSIED